MWSRLSLRNANKAFRRDLGLRNVAMSSVVQEEGVGIWATARTLDELESLRKVMAIWAKAFCCMIVMRLCNLHSHGLSETSKNLSAASQSCPQAQQQQGSCPHQHQVAHRHEPVDLRLLCISTVFLCLCGR